MAVIGIDLGTTNSLAVAFVNDEYVMIPNCFNEYLTPSVVSIDDDDSILVGKIARQRLITHPDCSASLFKRLMGSKKTKTLKGKKYFPEELSAFVVRQLVEDAKAFLKEDIEEVVISVPAYFNEFQRNATKRIGELIGIKVERLINEPSAAAIACHYGHIQDESFIVFDFGGGTLDVSVVDCFDNVVSICAIAGDNHLGGSDFDKLIALDFCEQHDIIYERMPVLRQESLLLQCEKAKILLQTQPTSTFTFQMNNQEYPYELTVKKLKAFSSSLFERMKQVIATAVNSSGFEKGEIDKLILVGGSCHMPIIIDYLHELMNIDVFEEQNMDQVVAMGLGTYIGIKQRKESVKQLVLTDICPFSLGVSVNNDANPAKPLLNVQIPRNTVLPAAKRDYYTPTSKYSNCVSMKVYQGEEIYAEDNIKLTDFDVIIPEGENRDFEVTFYYDINSILCIETHALGSGKKEQHYLNQSDANKPNMEAIKNAAMKLSLSPEVDLIYEQISRILKESNPNKQDYVKQIYVEFDQLMKKYKNNLRKRAKIVMRMKENLKELEDQGNTCDFFNLDEDDDNYYDDDQGNNDGYLS